MIFFKTATFALFSTEMFLIKNTVNETNVPFLLIKLTATLKIFFFKLFPQSKKTNNILTLANETCVYYKMHHKTKTKIIFKVVSKCSLISHVFFGTLCIYEYAFFYCSASGDTADGAIAQSAISSVCTGSGAFGDYIEVINIFGDYILR